MDGVEIATEKLDTCLEEMKVLLEAHYLEVHLFPDKIEFNPDYSAYLKMEQHDMVNITTARCNGHLVGYCLALIMPNIHYKDHKYAVNDVFYLDPKHRHGIVAIEMIEWAEQSYKNQGVSVMAFHMKTTIPFTGLMRETGLEHGENSYFKYIGE